MRFHCLFEQSGTFRDVFRSYGHKAYDYDIQNEYGKTDFQIDLFADIEVEYDVLNNPFINGITRTRRKMYRDTIFTNMNPETDFIIAFFPCTYFSGMQQLNFRLMNNGSLNSTKNIRTCQKNIEGVLEKVQNRADYFSLWIKFCYVCQELGIPTIIENPATQPSYVELFSPFLVSYKEKDRSLFGDKFIKPTNYFAINFDMKESFMMFDVEPKTEFIMGRGGKTEKFKGGSKERSEITSRYADNFYKRFLKHQLCCRLSSGCRPSESRPPLSPAAR